MILAGGVLLGGCDGNKASYSAPGGGGGHGGTGGTSGGAGGLGGAGGSNAAGAGGPGAIGGNGAAGAGGQGGTGGFMVPCANIAVSGYDPCPCYANNDPQGIENCHEYMQCSHSGGTWVDDEGAVFNSLATPGTCHFDGGAETDGDALTDGGAPKGDGSD